MDWQQAAISVGAVAVTGIVARLRKSGKDEQEIESLKENDKKQDKRLDDHDGRFEQLNKDFVPRPELEGILKDIRRSQDREERMLEALVLPRIRPINTDGEEK